MASYKSYSDVDDIELQRLNSNESTKENRKLDKSVNFSSDIDINGNKMPKTKNVQFSTHEVSFENEYEIEIKPNLIPNRKREEEQVMENLRKRVGELQLDKNWKRAPKENKRDEECDEEKSLLKHVIEEQTTEKDFIIDALCWINEYRARHSVNAISLSMKLCVSAQEWANHLANRNELYYCPPRIFNFGQNIFCCVEASLAANISGQEVVTYWYSTIKNYDYFKKPQLLHTNINSMHFTQIVWANTKFVGIAKAISKTGQKIFCVAFFYPAGNIIGEYQENVLPPVDESNSCKNETISIK
ncbi:hypothetical protein PVAND_001005 [Polypedilum vanderplanki]|uniref:SCP domain-containing protein n=1 Tax=Polypedilum vanderplanki TaxID=319348 RepID=A0A9J6BLM3_POLVA|nr:hypothetical protein PVAND_001005 [Polypedilum vanderplanki]